VTLPPAPGGCGGAAEAIAWWRTALLVLGTGLVLFVLSERAFFAAWRPGEDSPGAWFVTWLVYAVLGYPMLAAVAWARLGDAWGLVLAGSLFGWLAEGAVAGTLSGDPSMPFPFTIAWTALAWHMPLAVLAGWWWLGRALRAARPWRTLGWAAVLGIVWGVWGFAWRFHDTPRAMPVDGVVLHGALGGLGLALGHLAIAHGRPAAFRPARLPLAFAGAALGAVLLLAVVPRAPAAPALLAVLLLPLWPLLRRAGGAAPGASVLERLDAPLRPLNLLGLTAMPLAAAGVMQALGASGLDVPLHPPVVVLAMAGGTMALLAAAWRAARRPQPRG
jgi:hypothetical protein